ncbi:MAG: ATP-binding protein [Lachnospiraceae bacterium]|nr:ATP-binding protein [Lachnospiraceae bacterium]
MYRKLIEELKNWKNDSYRKPMIIRGARQVGKTWLMKEFGRTCYKRSVYISMDENEIMEEVFRDAFDIKRIVAALEIEAGHKIEPESTLIIFDEIQEIPRALKSLKYFCENAPEYHIVAAGSLLGVALHEGTSFPVGKVDFCDLYPLDFEEFLLACGEAQLAKLLGEHDKQLVTSYKNRYVDFLKYYYYIGGMPEVVSRYVDTRDLNVVRKTQNRLLSAYENDFSKHAPTEIVTRIKMVWNSIPTQLAKENKKFIYGLLREGARAKEYEVAITWLIDSGLIYKINRIKKSDFPLRAYQDFAAFKLFVVDVGLLGAMCKLSAKVLLNKNALFEEFKGALTEQYVLQQLVTNSDNDIFYWSADNATAELDFLVQNEDRIIPIEVKAEENLQAKSLRTFCNKNSVGRGVRVSMSDYREQDWMVNVPLYNLNRMYDVE